MHRSIGGSRVSYQDTTQNLKRRTPLCFEDWWFFLHQPKTSISMNYFPNICFQSRDLILSDCNFADPTIVQVILSHENCWIQWYTHEHSPYHRMFLSIFSNIHRWSFVFSALDHSHCLRIIRIPLTLLILFHRFQWSLWSYFSLRYHNGLLRSLTRFCLEHDGLPSSIVLGLLMKGTWLGLVSLSPRSYNGLDRSITHRFVSFPLLRRPRFVIIPLWVPWWESFHPTEYLDEKASSRLFGIIVKYRSWVAAHNGLPRSNLSLSFRTPGILIPIASLPGAYWSRRWQVRGSPCNKAHHWSWFRCVSFSSWNLL